MNLCRKPALKLSPAPDGIDGLNRERSSMKAVFAAFGECAFGATLDDNNRNEP